MNKKNFRYLIFLVFSAILATFFSIETFWANVSSSGAIVNSRQNKKMSPDEGQHAEAKPILRSYPTLSAPSDEIPSNMSGSTGTEIASQPEEVDQDEIKKEINTYIIESYKIQGTKIVKDLSQKLLESIPDETKRREAYNKIRLALELRKNRIENMRVSETRKQILEEFLNHMISLLKNEITDIER